MPVSLTDQDKLAAGRDRPEPRKIIREIVDSGVIGVHLANDGDAVVPGPGPSGCPVIA
jgi:hypothetical protein